MFWYSLPLITSINSSSSTTFMIFAIACSAGYLWATYIIPETANVSLEEIDAVFKSTAARDDMALKLQVSVH